MRYTFIGAGNMGGAIARGMIKAKVCLPEQIDIIDLDINTCKEFKELGCILTDEIVGHTVFIAVKPWQLNDIAPLIKGHSDVNIISVVAGVTLEELKDIFNNDNIVRVIPNTAVEYGAGVSFVCSDKKELAMDVNTLFAQLGASFIVASKELDACMVLGSCGLAYALRYARALQVGATEIGLKPQLSQQIIAATLKGAASILESPNTHAESEIDKITTPNGITIKGLNALEEYGFTNAVIQSLRASK